MTEELCKQVYQFDINDGDSQSKQEDHESPAEIDKEKEEVGAESSAKIEDARENNTEDDNNANEDAEVIDVKDGIANDEEVASHQRHLSMMVAESEDSDARQLAAFHEQRHVFVLTEAGKPVFALHGSEDKWAPLMGVIVALVSCVRDRKDNLRHIIAGEHKFVFLVKNHLILVGVCSTPESVQQINTYLEYIYDTLISIISGSKIEQIYSHQKNFDLRRLITDTDIKFFNNLCHSMKNDPRYFLESVQCYQVSSEVRECVGRALQLAKSEDLVYAILISDGRVVNTCRMKEHVLHTKDLQVLLNYINSSTSFDNGETWAPICLSHFNPNGFLHAHISYVDESKLQTCLVLLSADPEFFYKSRECKQKVVNRLEKTNCLATLEATLKGGFYRVEQLSIPQLRHFIYKNKDLAHVSQFTAPRLSSPYTDSKERERLFSSYEKLHGKVHDANIPLKLLYSVSNQETMLAWIATSFELYAAFGPLVTKQQAIQIVEKILKWVKSNEDELFISKAALF